MKQNKIKTKSKNLKEKTKNQKVSSRIYARLTTRETSEVKI